MSRSSVETFSFTRYGMLHGKILSVSRDADAAQNSAGNDSLAEGQSSNSAGAAQRPPAAGSPTYLATVSIDRSEMNIDGRREPLIPGMAVTAEIKTGRQSIMTYLLSPLARRANESLHER